MWANVLDLLERAEAGYVSARRSLRPTAWLIDEKHEMDFQPTAIDFPLWIMIAPPSTYT